MQQTDELSRQRKKMESLGQLAGGVAHELNNILQPIYFAVETIKYQAPNDIVVQNSVEKILSSTMKATDIIDDILAFAREDTDRLDFMRFDTSFSQALSFATELLPKTIMIETSDLPDSDYWAWLNSTDFIRILSNVLSNASDAMAHKGTICINVQYMLISSKCLKEKDIVGGGASVGSYACVSIVDLGGGFSGSTVSDMFSPFFTTKDIGEGTGLGLSIVYRIITNWKGFIEVNEHVHDKGVGVRFAMYIPVYKTDR